MSSSGSCAGGSSSDDGPEGGRDVAGLDGERLLWMELASRATGAGAPFPWRDQE